MATLECWVDMLLPQEASLFLPDDVALPPAAMFEVRVVIWKTKDVVSFDSVTNMNDLFVRVRLEGCDLQLDTDTHWRSKKGTKSPLNLDGRALIGQRDSRDQTVSVISETKLIPDQH